MKKLGLTLCSALIGVANSFAQVNLCPAYPSTTDNGWVNSFGTSNGQTTTLSVDGNKDGQTMYKSLGASLSNTWQAKLNFKPTANPDNNGTAMTILAVTSGIKPWNYDGVFETGTNFNNQDAISLMWTSNSGSLTNYFFWVNTKDDNSRNIVSQTIPMILNNNYEILLERVNATTGKLTVKNLTSNLSPSTIEFSLPSTIANLNTIQQGTILGASTSRKSTADISNLSIFDTKTGEITGEATVCKGLIVALETTNTGGTWSSSNPAIASVKQSGVVKGEGAGTATITYTNLNGCGSSNIISKEITVKDKLSFKIGGANVVCPNSAPIPYWADVSASVEGDFTWNIQDARNVSLSFPSAGSKETWANIPNSLPGSGQTSFIIRCQGLNECGASSIQTKTVSLSTDIPNVPNIICSGTTTSPVNSCVQISFDNKRTNDTYVWKNESTGTTLANLTSFTRPTSGNANADPSISLTFRSPFGCTKTSYYSPKVNCTYQKRVENSTPTEDYALKVYPNPNNCNFTFVTKGYTGKATVINVMGVVVKEFDIEETRTTYEVDMSNQANGTYLLRLTGGQDAHVSVFVKE